MKITKKKNMATNKARISKAIRKKNKTLKVDNSGKMRSKHFVMKLLFHNYRKSRRRAPMMRDKII